MEHMSAEEFRRYGKEVIDWIADYHESVENHSVLSQVSPGEIQEKLPKAAPKIGESFDALLADMEDIIMPGVTHWQSPNFFAYFPANLSGPSILGDLLSSGLGVQGMLWSTSPACTELETRVLDWLVPVMGLPQTFLSTESGGGVIQDTSSSAIICALLAAREQKAPSNRGGCRQPLVAYASTQTHSSMEKACQITGIGTENLRLIPVDDNFAMDPKQLRLQIQKDQAEGLIPFFVCGTCGTTSSNAFDPIEDLGNICEEFGIWLHVDAAMSGTAALCPEFQYLQQGVSLAHSYSFNPHKWMFTNFDCCCFWVANKQALTQALGILPEYLKNQATESGDVIDYRDWQIPLGRRFRSLKLWFVLRYYGVEGLRHHIRQHVTMAQEFCGWVDASDDFIRLAPAPLNLICFAHREGNAFNERLLETLNASGKIYLTHTKLQGRYALRMAIGQSRTQQHHVSQAWELIQSTAKQLLQSSLNTNHQREEKQGC